MAYPVQTNSNAECCYHHDSYFKMCLIFYHVKNVAVKFTTRVCLSQAGSLQKIRRPELLIGNQRNVNRTATIM
jgi:hypothetical protein